MNDTARGMYRKYTVQRMDGKVEHLSCRHFVLDVDHDPHALPALRAYAVSCRATHPKLADDIEHALASSNPAAELRKLF